MFWLDAKAEGKEVAISGRLSLCNFQARDAPWFAVCLNRKTAERAFSGGEALLAIASLELLGALAGIVLLCPAVDGPVESVGTATFTRFSWISF